MEIAVPVNVAHPESKYSYN